MISTVLVKSTVRPWPSVNLPSSSTWSRTLNTSGCAFSISSRSTTEYGRRLTASESWPPSSYPTYPGGAPTRRDTVCFSWYSPMSIRTIARSSSNRKSASARASSVLPTPVGPRNRNEPIGLRGSDSPARLRRIAFATAFTASSWPTTLRVEGLLHPDELLHLTFQEPLTGTPVHRLTTSATSSASTSSFSSAPSPGARRAPCSPLRSAARARGSGRSGSPSRA